MTRKEEILNACKEFLTAYPNIDQAGLSIGFLDGAVWADSHPINVWHDASEEPKCKKLIIIYRDDIGCIPIDTLIYHSDANYHWKELVKTYNIIRWAYAKDILPKGIEK